MATTQRRAARLIRPMLATAGPLPPPPGGGDWAYELKWDGVRAVAYLGAGPFRLLSRTDQDMTSRYPERAPLADAHADEDEELVLDGELVTLLDSRPSFSLLQQRMQVRSPSAELIKAVPVMYFVAKRLDSTYRPGARTRDWIKTKNIRTQEVVIGGWTEGQGRRTGTIGALLLGIPDPAGRLRYVGQVGTGFTGPVLRDLQQRLAAIQLDQSPFNAGDGVPREHTRGAHWVQPAIVGEVAFAEWTHDHVLRHPSWRGYRPDKQPGDVRRE